MSPGRSRIQVHAEREGLFTVATAPTKGRLLDFFAVLRQYKRLVGDACNAYFHTPQNRQVYFVLPEELRQRVREQGGDPEGKVGVLRKKLDSERDASVEFGDMYADIFTGAG